MANLAPYNKQEASISQDIEMFDVDKKNSVVNVVSDTVRDAILSAYKECPDLFLMDERDLFKTLSANKGRPTPTDNRLRIKFWDEFNKVHFKNQEFGSGHKMDMVAIYSGVCTKHYFYNKYIKSSQKIAWIMCQPATYAAKMEEMLSYGIEQFRDILDLPHFDVNSKGDIIPGSINTKLLAIKAKIIDMVEQRQKGAVVQKSVNLSFNASSGQVSNAAMAQSMADLDKKLALLDKKDKLKAPEPEPPKEGDIVVEMVENK